jgi:hypothetical protein
MASETPPYMTTANRTSCSSSNGGPCSGTA